MVNQMVISLAVIFCLGVTIYQVDALQCWKCQSDRPGMSWCDDKFDSSKVNNTVKHIYYVNCVNVGQFQPSCRKIERKVNGKTVVERNCGEHKAEPKTKAECVSTGDMNMDDKDVEFCQICKTDGCNGASSLTALGIFILLPFAVAKIFANY